MTTRVAISILTLGERQRTLAEGFGFLPARRVLLVAISMTEPHETSADVAQPPSEIRIDSSDRVRRRPSTTSNVGDPPRLSIAHVLLWTGCVAACFGLTRIPFDRLSPAILYAVFGAIIGAAWAGSLVVICRRLRLRSWPIEPGHWLCLFYGVSLLLEIVAPMPSMNSLASGAIIAMLPCLVLVAATFSCDLGSKWRVVFILLVVLMAFPWVVLLGWVGLPGRLSYTTSPYLFLFHLVLAVAVVSDWSNWRRYTWLHWVGVGVWLSMAAVNMVFMFVA